MGGKMLAIQADSINADVDQDLHALRIHNANGMAGGEQAAYLAVTGSDHIAVSRQKQAALAQKELFSFPQEKLDAITAAVAAAFQSHAAELAQMAVEETGFGNVNDKITKNEFASKAVASAIEKMTCVGVLKENPREKLWEIGVPVGVIAAIVPSTNPTSTVCYKTMIALKSGNAIVFSPHPKALACTLRATQIVAKAAEEAGVELIVVDAGDDATKQVSDIEEETNGFYTYDRRILKMDKNTVCQLNDVLKKAIF